MLPLRPLTKQNLAEQLSYVSLLA